MVKEPTTGEVLAPWIDGDVKATAARLRRHLDAGGNVYAAAFGMVEDLSGDEATRALRTVAVALDLVTKGASYG